MKTNQLGKTNIHVSKICLGTMTWGQQNTKEQAHEQLDYAFERQVNFFDTAEMYPVSPTKETYTLTEQYIGQWDKIKTNRNQIIMATKVAGPSDWMAYTPCAQGFTKEGIIKACEGSLKRLQTEYIDVYQIHWPGRATNYFGQLSYPDQGLDNFDGDISEVVDALITLHESGKIKYIGLSNETPWGVMKYLSELEKRGKRDLLVSIQNPYNLLNRSFEIGLSEFSHREKIGLMAYSPMAFGVLSGKYLNGQKPKGARLTIWDRFSRYTNENGVLATKAYADLAKELGTTPAILSLAFVNSKSFVVGNIIGATNMDQLKENIDSMDFEITPEINAKIEEIHTKYTIPCP